MNALDYSRSMVLYPLKALHNVMGRNTKINSEPQ